MTVERAGIHETSEDFNLFGEQNVWGKAVLAFSETEESGIGILFGDQQRGIYEDTGEDKDGWRAVRL